MCGCSPAHETKWYVNFESNVNAEHKSSVKSLSLSRYLDCHFQKHINQSVCHFQILLFLLLLLFWRGGDGGGGSLCCCYSTTDDKASVASLGSSRLPAICVHSCSTKHFNLMLYYLLLHLSRQCVMLPRIPADRQAEKWTGLPKRVSSVLALQRSVLFTHPPPSRLLQMKDVANVSRVKKETSALFPPGKETTQPHLPSCKLLPRFRWAE